MFNLLLSFVFNLCDVYNGGVIDDMQSNSSNKPSNTNTFELDLNNGGWYVIAILIGIIIVLISVMIYKANKAQKVQTTKTENISTDTTQEDKQLLNEYHKLNSQEKQVINDTIKTFNNSKDE